MNISIGVLGHVDSGKTTLSKLLSTVASTAAFDSNPQSIERRITLDLGFSSFTLNEKWNCTLVDCPGHSTLIRTVIGGSQIMDVMLLIVDITKGMQAQTAECLILAQISSAHLIVLLNKVDLIPPSDREDKILRMTKLMKGVLGKTKFSDTPIIPVSAVDPSIGIALFKEKLAKQLESMKIVRDTEGQFLMAVDHCFSKKGQGAILTGTILQGRVQINDVIEIPTIGDTKKVKSIEAFRVPLQEAAAGDRVGLCIPGLNSALIERTVICAPKSIRTSVRVAIVSIQKIHYFKYPIESKRRYHISVGYETTTAKMTFFQSLTPIGNYSPHVKYEYLESIPNDVECAFAVAEFDSAITVLPKGFLIGSDLQSEISGCRLAFSGYLEECSEDKNYLVSFLPRLQILRKKEKTGLVDRVHGSSTLIVKGFSKKESNINYLVGLNVTVDLDRSGSVFLAGRIECRFGQTTKLRVELMENLTGSQMDILKSAKTNGAGTVHLKFALNYFKTNKVNKLIVQY